MPPNLVLIVTDNQSPWTLGCYGNRDIRTPNVDRLADEGGEPLLGTTALEGTLEGLTSTDGATAADGRVTVWGLEVRWTLRAETAATGLQLVLSDQPVTLAKLGNRHGVSRERIRQVEKKIIDRFRTYLLAKLPDLERHLYD